MNQGQYPIGTRQLAPTDSATGVVTGTTADIPMSYITAYTQKVMLGTFSGYLAVDGMGNLSASTTVPAGAISGLGDLALQNSASVNLTGGTINGTFSGLATGLNIGGNAATATSATSSTTSTNLAGGAANRIAYQSGTGATTFTVAPTVSNTVLTWNGSAFAWAVPAASGVTSVDVSGGTTGLTTTGGPITTSGTITMAGTLAIANGGTGQTSASAALNALGGVGAATVTPLLKRLAPNFVNSGCLVAQRLTSTIGTTSRLIGQADNIGMWGSGGTLGGFNIQRVVNSGCGTTGFAARGTSVTFTGAGQLSCSIRMEANDAAKYKNKTASFSVRVIHAVGSNINYVLVVNKPFATADVWTSKTVVSTSSATSVVTATDTLLTFNNVALGDVSKGLELEVQAVCGAVSIVNFDFTEFYVNIEASAGSYDASTYSDDLLRCQRYLQTFPSVIITQLGMGQVTTLTTANILFPFTVPMRIAPTSLGFPNGVTAVNYSITSVALSPIALTTLVFATASTTTGALTATVTAGVVAGSCTIFESNAASNQSFYFLGSEL